MLERNRFTIRVAHRTLKAQKAEAERKGDTFLARLFSRIPENELVMKLEALTKGTEELKTKDAVQVPSIRAKNLMYSPEYTAQKK